MNAYPEMGTGIYMLTVSYLGHLVQVASIHAISICKQCILHFNIDCKWILFTSSYIEKLSCLTTPLKFLNVTKICVSMVTIRGCTNKCTLWFSSLNYCFVDFLVNNLISSKKQIAYTWLSILFQGRD